MRREAEGWQDSLMERLRVKLEKEFVLSAKLEADIRDTLKGLGYMC
jgi:hypothetical protein